MTAWSVLNRLHQRPARRPAQGVARAVPARQVLEQLYGRRRANDVLGDIFSIDTPGSVKSELEQLRASYEIVNRSAKGDPDWDIHYAEWLAFYERTKDVGWFSNITGGTINQIRDRRKQLEAWREKLAAAGVKVGEPPRRDPERTGDGVRDAAVAIGGVLVLLWLLRSTT